MEKLLYGRELLLSEIPEDLRGEMRKNSAIEKVSSYFELNNRKHCTRCRAQMVSVESDECICNKDCAYCRNCLKMGKVRACTQFFRMPEMNDFTNKEKKLLEWTGKLSNQQAEASKKIIESIQGNQKRLLWAVTGAGKTEMLFPGIEYALLNNKRVCIAAPRVDVVLELAPRLKAAFPKVPVAVLYGGTEEAYAYTQLVISTTHQLFRFKEAFDVMIIDEIDAFPFASDKTLHFAADKARKKESALIYLSATPSQNMQKDVASNKLSATILPARYHGYELPVPKTKFCYKWREKLLEHPLKTSFGKKLDRLIQRNRRFLVFAPNIEWMLAFEKQLYSLYPNVRFEAVSAEDPDRKEKVLEMRRENVQFLLTSTILERGVTFPDIDVLVIGAEDRIFTEPALVQIAGRVGRSPQHPTGDVWFFHNGQSLAMKRAIRQIKTMNKRARMKGAII